MESQLSSDSSPPSVPSGDVKHRIMYKLSPDFRQLYREHCLSALHRRRNEMRNKLVDKLRNIDINDEENGVDSRHLVIDDVMRTVWDRCSSFAPSMMTQDQVIDFMAEIRQELQRDETHYWEELLESRHDHEIEWLLDNRDSVVCFMCKKSSLYLSSSDHLSRLACDCGFHCTINCQIPLTLSSLQQRIDNLISNHNRLCNSHDIIFGKIELNDINKSQNVIMLCNKCGKREMIF